jgi:TPR repeat protein
MWSSNPDFQKSLEIIPEELRLIHCVNLVETSSDQNYTIEALNYLRQKATAHHDTEAKTKLSILFQSPNASPHLLADPNESMLWSRSVFDKQLAQALYHCAAIFNTSDDLSTMHFIETMTANLNSEPALCYLAGLLYTKSIGFEQDIQKGVQLLKHAATEGRIAEAGCELGRIYGDRYRYSLQQPAEAMHWFHLAFECGSTQAVVDLAYGFFEGNHVEVPKDDARALRYAKDGALLNDKYCQYIVGHLHLKGRGVDANAQEAVKWLHASAQQGFAVALEEETSVYMYGQGNVKQDYEKALQCCLQSEAQNIPFCQARLGDMYRNAWGVMQDFHKAFEYYQNAASQSDTPYPYAQHMLGEM